MSVEAHKKTPPSAPGLPDPSQTPSTPIDPSSLSLPEKRLYDFLCAQGWTDEQSSSFVTHIEPMKDALSHHFYSQGWSTDQVQFLHERCQMDVMATTVQAVLGAALVDSRGSVMYLEEVADLFKLGWPAAIEAGNKGEDSA